MKGSVKASKDTLRLCLSRRGPSSLKLALSKLSLREKQIMNMRFGLDGEEEFTQKEVADILGISQSYISRLEKKIVERLKKEFKKYS